MASTSETGHAKNVANFQNLIAFITGYGATYNPSKNALKLPELNTLYAAAQASLADVITKNTAYNNQVNERVVAFKDIKSLSTRLINALETTDATAQKIADAKALNKKMQGKKAKETETPTDPNTPPPTPFQPVSNPTTNKFSTWQVSFPFYNPNQVMHPTKMS